jgi:general secretion pathway protein L
MLIIALPHTAAEAAHGYAHVHSDGHSVLRHATGVAATLSAHAGEVVAVIPHSRLSWLTVQLPPASHGPRLAAVLHGLLEDRLLSDADQLHIVPAPQTADIARQGGAILVAVCDKAWLRQALTPLQTAGLHVQRIVPELSPSAAPTLHVMGTPDNAQCVLSHDQGVALLPPNTAQWHAFVELQQSTLQIQAEPAMVARVQDTLQRQPMLQSAPQRWMQATHTEWDLAQGEWAQGRPQRAWRWLQHAWQNLRHAPAYKPLRYGVFALLALQVLGLNVVAWREQAALNQQRTALSTVLQTTFPQVSLVVDAPLQMQREVDALQQKSGLPSSTDFEPLLSALAQALPAGQTPTDIHFANHALRVKGITPNERATAQLQAQGLSLRAEGDVWVLQAQGATP